MKITNDVTDSMIQNGRDALMVISAKIRDVPARSGGLIHYLVPTEFICSCPQGHNKIQHTEERDDGKFTCSYCGNRGATYSLDLISQEADDVFTEYDKYCFGKGNKISKTNVNVAKTIYFRKSIDKNGFEIFVGNTKISSQNNKALIRTATISRYVSFALDAPVELYKVSKKSMSSICALDFFYPIINDDYLYFVYENSNNLFEFLANNNEFAKEIGVFEALKYVDLKDDYCDENKFFITYLFLITLYPAIKVLVKDGYIKLYNDILNDIFMLSQKNEIMEKINLLNSLFNATNDNSFALSIPSYISEYLKEKSANLEEYFQWCNIYKLDTLNKEDFERIINSMPYYSCVVNGHLSQVINMMKYGYEFEKLLNYLYEQTSCYHTSTLTDYDGKSYTMKGAGCSFGKSYSAIIHILENYLKFIESKNIDFDLYPSNIMKAYEEITKRYI